MTAEAPATHAALALAGRTLRYAEVEREGSGPGHLRRLGACEFDFDVDHAVLGGAGPTYLETVSTAVCEVFARTTARVLTVVAPPSALVGFSTPLPDGLPAVQRYEQLRQEAALLADVSPTQPARIRAAPVRVERLPSGPHVWHHVLHVPEMVHARLVLLGRSLGMGAYDLVEATRAAAAVIRTAVAGTEVGEEGPPQYELVVGLWGGRAEFALCRQGAWYAGHHGPAHTSEDATYFALAMLERMRVSPVHLRRLFVYGDEAAPARFSLLADFLGLQAELLDPLALFGRRPPNATPAALSAYAPCIGALLA
ncbi:MAG TPA: hypothetical protein VD962_04365 [Rubricoccaceae bacterium]|nr:hypothetical protein [Rubricoccaceae bacterium]